MDEDTYSIIRGRPRHVQHQGPLRAVEGWALDALAKLDSAAPGFLLHLDAFLTRKRQWLFNTLRELEAVVTKRAVVPRFMTGSKIPYRGRMTKLTVRRHDGPHLEIGFKNGFVVDLPTWVRGKDQDGIVATEIKLWLKRRVRRDVTEIAAAYQRRFGLKPRTIRVADMKTGWGACGPTGAILINWTLVFAPKAVLEYVVAHELAHLRVRSHGPEFWAEMAAIMPDYTRPKAWLDQHQGALDAGFLNRDVMTCP